MISYSQGVIAKPSKILIFLFELIAKPSKSPKWNKNQTNKLCNQNVDFELGLGLPPAHGSSNVLGHGLLDRTNNHNNKTPVDNQKSNTTLRNFSMLPSPPELRGPSPNKPADGSMAHLESLLGGNASSVSDALSQGSWTKFD